MNGCRTPTCTSGCSRSTPPPSVIVNEEHEILHLSERAGRYLQFSGGEPSHNLLKAVRPELRIELRSALYVAAQDRTAVDVRGLTFDDRGTRVVVDVSVRPVLREDDVARGFFLVMFRERHRGGAAVSPRRRSAGSSRPSTSNRSWSG